MCITMGRGRPVINPSTWIKARTPSNRFLLTFNVKHLKMFRRLMDNVEGVKLPAPVLKSIWGLHRGVDVCVAALYFGAPAAAMALEMLIAGGADTFIVVGGAGSISPGVKIGDVLIPTWGIREEGTSYHYAHHTYVPKPNARLVDALYEELLRLRGDVAFNVLKGGIWSTDAVFRETLDKVERYSRLGVYGVDMESTALMTIADYRGVDLAIVTLITDELYEGKWRVASESRERLRKARSVERLVIKTSLNAITKL